ncbi:hypothetical protein F441_20456 [Phytophthora nicotianae CJ01A1]|uniref:Ubiquitin-like protease family profile domain-containing protein n=1 Tax=Phytophthora nicotianae CJ01A1 TaxID=1317063 RepID=W2VWD5_PHYNI|nr:hypothetical protein F441_20456 [Phytophthora nicotianae CJ01A1]
MVVRLELGTAPAFVARATLKIRWCSLRVDTAGENGGNGGKLTGVHKEKSKRGSEQVVHDKAKKRRKLRPFFPHEAESSTSSDLGDDDKGGKAEDVVQDMPSDDVDLPSHFRFEEEKEPRDRSSKTTGERDSMIAAHVNVDNHPPPVSRNGYATLSGWITAYDEYCTADNVTLWMRTTFSVDFYNRYVVPEDLVISLQAGIDYYRSQQAAEHKAQNEDHNVVDLICTPSSADDTTLAVWVTPELDLFSRTKKSWESWGKELTWLLQDWSKTAPTAKQHLIQLANDVVPKYLSLSLQSKISRGDTNKSIYFDDVVGYLADGAWLNEAVISYCLDVRTENRDDVHVLSSLVIQKEKFPTPPRRKRFSMKSVVLPINHSNAHWTIIIVVVDRHGMARTMEFGDEES